MAENKSKPGPVKRRVDEEFKRSVVEHLLSSGKTVAQVAEDFGVQRWNLRDWLRRYGPGASKPGSPIPEEAQAMTREIERLRKELARVESQRDILKKTLTIMAEL